MNQKKAEDNSVILGIGLGILIGVISGTVALVLLRTANSLNRVNLKPIIAITAEILAIPTFWFGGPWLTGTVLVGTSTADFINPYVMTLACTFSVLMAYPVFRWVVKVGTELGREVEHNA